MNSTNRARSLSWLAGFFGIISAFATSWGQTSAYATELEEVAIEKVMVPSSGYDDNDNVVILVEGTLPDRCYVLGKTEVQSLPDNTFEVRQYAWRREGGICSGRDDLDESPFSVDVSLGRLNAGDYKVVQHPQEGQTTFRSFNVSKALLTSMDQLNYANVTEVTVADAVMVGQNVRVTLRGILASSCNVVSEVKVERQGDVFVLLPIEVQKGDCGYVLRNFSREVDLGKLTEGEFLVHVRAKNGRAVQRTVSVLRYR